jgi:hypothetical protein
MIKYIFLLFCYIPFYLLGLLLAPILPFFREMRDGPINNGNGTGIAARLPEWLFWFDTSYDNSLYGDGGWREKHCPVGWDTHWGMTKWLWRNCACGFSWSVLAQDIKPTDTFTYTHSGNGLDVDKGKGKLGWYKINCSNGAFSLRWCKRIAPNVVLSFEAGWLLDVYIKDPDNSFVNHPKATFQFQPQIKRI